MSFDVSRIAGENVGAYEITLRNVKIKTGNPKNYNVFYYRENPKSIATGTYTILPAPATVTGQNASKQAGEADPPFNATVTGMRRGDPTSVITYTIGREAGEEEGRYAITPTGAVNQGNYTVTYVPATLTIQAVEEIEEPEPPKAPPEEIEDDETPMALMPTWALINLIATILTVCTAAGMIITYFKKKEEDEEENEDGVVRQLTDEEKQKEEEENERKRSKFLGLIPGIGSVITFLLTEDMSAKMVLVDKWTILMIAILAIGAAMAYLTRDKKDEEEEQPEEA